MIGSLSNLILAQTMLQFFFAWELMTLSSYLLILRGKKANQAALNYVLFSLGGAYVILGGLALAHLPFLAAIACLFWGKPVCIHK